MSFTGCEKLMAGIGPLSPGKNMRTEVKAMVPFGFYPNILVDSNGRVIRRDSSFDIISKEIDALKHQLLEVKKERDELKEKRAKEIKDIIDQYKPFNPIEGAL
jgi:hypothetical protein